MKEEWMRMTLRLPIELRDWIEGRTKDTRRSMNGEIVACLEHVQRKEEEPATDRLSRA